MLTTWSLPRPIEKNVTTALFYPTDGSTIQRLRKICVYGFILHLITRFSLSVLWFVLTVKLNQIILLLPKTFVSLKRSSFVCAISRSDWNSGNGWKKRSGSLVKNVQKWFKFEKSSSIEIGLWSRMPQSLSRLQSNMALKEIRSQDIKTTYFWPTTECRSLCWLVVRFTNLQQQILNVWLLLLLLYNKAAFVTL